MPWTLSPPESGTHLITGITGYVVRHITGDSGGSGALSPRWRHFLAEARRKVQKDRIVSLDGKAYEVDASLVGQTVVLRFDPSLPGRSIQIHADGKRWEAKLVDTYANCFVKRDRPSQLLTPGTPPKTPAPEVATPEKPLAPSTLNLAELAARKQEDR